MDGPNLIVRPAQSQQPDQHLNGHSNHNANCSLQVNGQEQSNLQQQATHDNSLACNSEQIEQYDRLTSATSINKSQHEARDNNLETRNNGFAFEFGEMQRKNMSGQHLSSTDNYHPQAFSLDGTNNQPDCLNLNHAGDCDINQSMVDDDDAFIAFCADSSSVLNNDSNRKYHINKLYQPLSRVNAGSHIKSIDHDHRQQAMEQDDEYMLYQELRFMESSAQDEEISDSGERTELGKIFDDDDDDAVDAVDGDDCDGINTQSNDIDPLNLDCLNLTNLIESFNDFDDTPLIDSCNGETDHLISEPPCSHESTSPVKPDSSGIGNEYSPGGHVNSTNNEYTREISSNNNNNNNNNNNQYMTPMNTNHQYHDIFLQQQPDSCYTTISNNSTLPTYNESDITSIDQMQTNDCQYTISGQLEPNHPNMTRENDGSISTICTNPLPSVEQINNVQPTEATITIKRSMKPNCKRKNSIYTADTPPTREVQLSVRKLKKRRSTPATKKSQSVLSANNTSDYEQEQTRAREAEQIKVLTSRLLNDEDESMISDNSFRSDGSKPVPFVNHYRRRTANARERIRMREINQAFEKLKKVVPAELIRQAILESEEMSDQGVGRRKSSPSGGKSSDHQSDSMKLTKITTLRLAVSYIGKLSEMLSQCPENPPVKLIAKSEESLSSSSDNLTKVIIKKSREDKTSKTERRSRARTKKSARVASEKKVDIHPTRTEVKTVQVSEMGNYLNQSNDSNHSAEKLDQPSRNQQQLEVSTQNNNLISSNRAQSQQQHQQQCPQTIQTAFISIANQQKPQFLSAYPTQQPMLISQQMTNGTKRQLVTPVTVAILGIPSNNGQVTSNTNNTRGLQILNVQNAQQTATPMVQHHQPRYNIQFSQPQAQNCNSQQVTLTLDDLNGMSVMRLSANSHLQNQSVPIQIKTTGNQFFGQTHQQTQIFTASNGLSYAFRPVPSGQQPNNTNLITTLGGAITTPSNCFQVCNNNNNGSGSSSNNNNNNNNNLITQNISNNNIGNNIFPATIVNNNPSIISGHQQTMQVNGQIVCNISQSSRIINSNSTGTTTTGNISQQQIEDSSISSCGQIGRTQHALDSNKVFQLTQLPLSDIQQQNPLFVQNTNLMPISSSTSCNQSIQSQPIPIVGQIGSSQDQDQPRKANVVYISHMATTNPQQQQQQQQQQICLVGAKTSQNLPRLVGSANESSEEELSERQQAVTSNGPSNTDKLVAQNKMEYINHFGIHAQSSDKHSQSETNISKLVASLATSIQPMALAKNTNTTTRTKTSNDSRKSQQQEQQNQQQQHAVRTYRFHNYDGDMINSHLYGSNNSDRQQANNSQKRTQAMRQLQDNVNKMAERPAPGHRSRQNSLSSICSTVSCSSSSPNSTLSTGNSPANLSFGVMKSPKSDAGHHRSGSNSSPILIDEIRAS